MPAPTIIRIPILPFGMINAHLIVTPDACVLVDAGLPGSENKIARALARLGRSLADISLIVVTHAHVDHAGSAARLRDLSGAPIVAHAHDTCHFNGTQPMTFCATGWFGRLFLKTRLIMQPYAPFVPDILLNDTDCLDLQAYGIAGTVRHTPGHAAGSVSVVLDGGAALVGDLIASGILLGGIARTGHAQRPPFEDDAQAVANQLQQLLADGACEFYMGHGGPLPAPEVGRHINTLRRLGARA